MCVCHGSHRGQRTTLGVGLLPGLKHSLFFLLHMPDYLGCNFPEDSPVSASHHAIGVLGLAVHTVLPAFR